MLKLISESRRNENDLVSLTLDELARLGAKKLLAEALELEVEDYINRNKSEKMENGHRHVVRNGRHKERKVTTGAGTLKVRAPRIKDRREGENFVSRILPPYLRKSANVESVLPALYLKGLSGNAFSDALSELLGSDVGGLSASSISALKKTWVKELEEWRKAPIEDEFVYLWADGVNIKIRLGEDKKLCLLVVIGVTSDGHKRVVGVESGYRESAESWKLLFRNLITRGLQPPMLVIGDGALGLWKAVDQIPEFDYTKTQRCWVHKIANVLDKLPKRLQPQAKKMLHDIMNAEKKEDAVAVKREFEMAFEDKYPKAAQCLSSGFVELLTFFDFPAKHWQHIRTTNPIESAFATVKLRTRSTKGSGSAQMAETMALKLLLEAQKKWRTISGADQLPILLEGGVYKDGILVESPRTRLAANG